MCYSHEYKRKCIEMYYKGLWSDRPLFWSVFILQIIDQRKKDKAKVLYPRSFPVRR